MPNNTIESISRDLAFGGARDAALVSLASKSTWGGMLTSFYGWFTQSGSAVFIGILVTILGFGMNYLFQKKKEKREKALWEQQFQANLRAEERKDELHRARLAAMELGIDSDTNE